MTVSMTANDVIDAPVQPLQWKDSSNPGAGLPLECSSLADRQAKLSKAELCDLQAGIVGPRGLFAAFSVAVTEQGRQADMLEALPDSTDPARLALAEKAVEFVLGHHHRRVYTENPFMGLPRATLCCAVYDPSSSFTLAERYAANEALRLADGQFFINLIATTHNTVERRVVFRGLLEHFDALLPIEQSIYPEGYRDVQQRYLDREEQLYGKLSLDKPLRVIFEEQTPQSLLASLEKSS